jgi:hypothetical protein
MLALPMTLANYVGSSVFPRVAVNETAVYCVAKSPSVLSRQVMMM